MLAAARRSLAFLSKGERVTYFTLVGFRALVGILDVAGIFFIGLIAAIAIFNIAVWQPMLARAERYKFE